MRNLVCMYCFLHFIISSLIFAFKGRLYKFNGEVVEPVPLDVDRLLGTSLKMQVGSSVSDLDPHEGFCPDPDLQKKCGSETLILGKKRNFFGHI